MEDGGIDYDEQAEDVAMNYYEELGIKPEADEEEIRKAHRRLVRLMHPDQHRDQAMKQLAETQMRRLNSIVATLLDGERRREYDEQLRARTTAAHAPAETAWRKVPWWIASTVGAIVLTVGAVWFWADHLGSSFNSRTTVSIVPANPEGSKPATPANPPASESLPQSKKAEGEPAQSNKQEPSAGISATVVSPGPGESSRPILETPKNKPAQNNRTQTAPAQKPKTLNLPPNAHTIAVRAIPSGQSTPLPPPPGVSAGNAPREEVAALSMSTLPVAVAPKPDPHSINNGISSEALRSAASGDPAEGEWVYAPKEPEKHKAGFYPPTYISLKLNKYDTGLRGQYSARYEVTDNKPISPEVSFQLTAVDKTSRKFVWQASNGSRGTLAIRSIDGRTMRLEWRTTVFTGQPALTSGIATLVRREP